MKPALLIEYEELAETAVVLMNEENRHLRTIGTPPDEALLQRKRSLLENLEEKLICLREAGGGGAGWPTEALAGLQQRFLQITRLDRENEKLLLAVLANPQPVPTDAGGAVRSGESGGESETPAKSGRLRRIAKFLSQ